MFILNILVSAWGFEPVALTAKFYSSSCAALLLILFADVIKRESIPLLSKLNVWGRTITLGELPRSG